MEYSELIQGFADRYGIAGLAAADGMATVEIDGLKVSLIHDDAADAVTIYGEVGFPPPDANEEASKLLMEWPEETDEPEEEEDNSMAVLSLLMSGPMTEEKKEEYERLTGKPW